MTKRIITISREFGSGGRFIGEEVAKKLGIKYYDKEIIGQIAKESGLAPEYIKENAELAGGCVYTLPPVLHYAPESELPDDSSNQYIMNRHCIVKCMYNS